jgi:phage portal protein BeeE
VGLETATAKASHEDARRQAYEAFLIPSQASIGEDIDIQLMPDFDRTGLKQVNWDYSGIAALSENQNDLATRWARLYQSGVCMRSEARAKVGLEKRDGGDDDVFVLGAREALLDVDGNLLESTLPPAPVGKPLQPAAVNGNGLNGKH